MAEGKLDRLGIARALREMARLLDLAGDTPFKVRAYDRAAQALERLGADLGHLVKEERLTELHGIGRRLAAVISELYLTGSSKALEKLRRQYPPGAAELSRIPELGLKRIKILSAAGIETMSQLKEACAKGRLRAIKGIGEKTEQRILDRIHELEAPSRVLLPEAAEAAEELLAYLREAPGTVATAVAGGLRRCTEIVDKLVLVLGSTKPASAAKHGEPAPSRCGGGPDRPVIGATCPD